MPGKEFEEIKKLSPETLLKIDTWLNTWPVGGVSSLGSYYKVGSVHDGVGAQHIYNTREECGREYKMAGRK